MKQLTDKYFWCGINLIGLLTCAVAWLNICINTVDGKFTLIEGYLLLLLVYFIIAICCNYLIKSFLEKE